MKAPPPLEHDSQVALIEWWSYSRKRWGPPEFALLAVPNAGAGASKGQAGKMKAEGVRAGVPDLFLAVYQPRTQRCGLWIEMKRPGRQPELTQIAVMSYLQCAGYECVVCYSTDDAIWAIERYLG